jgi:heme A synthase
MTMKNLADHNIFRKRFFRYSYILFPLILITGFFTSAIEGQKACNTFPKVGPHWFLMPQHFFNDIPLWKNFTENKLVV